VILYFPLISSDNSEWNSSLVQFLAYLICPHFFSDAILYNLLFFAWVSFRKLYFCWYFVFCCPCLARLIIPRYMTHATFRVLDLFSSSGDCFPTHGWNRTRYLSSTNQTWNIPPKTGNIQCNIGINKRCLQCYSHQTSDNIAINCDVFQHNNKVSWCI